MHCASSVLVSHNINGLTFSSLPNLWFVIHTFARSIKSAFSFLTWLGDHARGSPKAENILEKKKENFGFKVNSNSFTRAPTFCETLPIWFCIRNSFIWRQGILRLETTCNRLTSDKSKDLQNHYNLVEINHPIFNNLIFQGHDCVYHSKCFSELCFTKLTEISISTINSGNSLVRVKKQTVVWYVFRLAQYLITFITETF